MVAANAPGTPGVALTDWRSLYPFKSNYLRIGELSLHYLDEGSGTGAPMLLVHGNPTWSFYWREVVHAFRPERRMIAPDHIGCGLSDKPRDWSYRLADHVSNLERLVLELDLREITLIVHDWGGPIGLGVATRHPERFARLVLLNTAAFPSKAIPMRIAVCRTPLLGPLAVRGLNAFARAATSMATEKGLDPLVRDGLLAPYGSWADRIAIQRFVEDIPLDERHPSWQTLAEIESGLERLKDKPNLLIWGERDWCFTPDFRREFERRFPNASVRAIAEVGHYVVEDAPEQVIEAIRAFVHAPHHPEPHPQHVAVT